MSERHHLSAYLRGRVVEWLETGQSVTTVATAMGVSKSIISQVKNSVKGAMRQHADSRGRKTTPQDDRYVPLMVKETDISLQVR